MAMTKQRRSNSFQRSNRKSLSWRWLIYVTPLIYAGTLLWAHESPVLLGIHENGDETQAPTQTAPAISSAAMPLESLQCPSWTERETAPSELPPIWVPSYPGCGSELFRDLVHSWTGAPASDVYYWDVCKEAATCKTHWPSLGDRRAPSSLNEEFSDQAAWLLVRHPRKALPSYANFRWEVNNGISDHSQQAPEEAWLIWRDRRFERDIKRWASMIRTWYNRENSPVPISLLIPYEDLIDADAGPALISKIHTQLQEVGHTMAPLNELLCDWKHHVVERPAKKRASRGYQPTFTVPQLDQMLQTLVDLQEECGFATELVAQLKRYQIETEQDLQLAMVLQEQEGSPKKR